MRGEEGREGKEGRKEGRKEGKEGSCMYDDLYTDDRTYR